MLFRSDFGDFHIVGVIENQGTDTYYTSLLGGVYDANGLVVDAGTVSVPLYIKAGEVVPFDVSYWNLVSWNDEISASIDTFTVQIDPYWTYTVDYDLVDLTNVTTTKDERSSGKDQPGRHTGQ